jgi:hypothetical protein
MPLSKVNISRIAEDSSVTSAKIADDSIVNADINASAAIGTGKTADTFKTQTEATTDFNTKHFNVALLGFKMAVNDSLTVFNLVDGVVDEFHDESGADEGEGSNDTYNSSDDYYINSTQPDGASVPYSAGFGRTDPMTPLSEPTTSEASEGPFGQGAGAPSSTFTVPTGVTSVNIQAWGAGGTAGPGGSGNDGGGGGYAEGTLAVTASQVIYNFVGEGGVVFSTSKNGGARGGGGSNDCHPSGDTASLGGGGGATFISSATSPQVSSAPQLYVVAGAGGGGGIELGPGITGGAGGGLVGGRAGPSGIDFAQNNNGGSGGGGSQTAGGQQGSHPTIYDGQAGSFLGGGKGADTPQGTAGAGGGSGFYGGGGGGGAVTAPTQNRGHGGGGSSYYGHPQITSGATTAGSINDSGEEGEGGGVTQPGYSPGTNDGGARPTGSGQDGFILLTAAASATATSTTIVSNAFTASSAPSTSRIVVFQENIDSITLNTDIVASVSRDGGSNFSTVTLADEGYVTGASGQRILAGVVDISGQPSGTSLRWKLALANNQSKIHGVSLSWA